MREPKEIAMSHYIFRGVVAVSLLTAPSMTYAAGDEKKTLDEKKKLQGEWEVTEYTFLKNVTPGEAGNVWKFTANTITVSRTKETWTYKADVEEANAYRHRPR
jgi:hypothetical protein